MVQMKYLQSRNRVTDVENKFMVTRGEKGGGMHWEIGADINILLCIKQWKTQSQKPNQTDHMDHSLVWLNDILSHAVYGHPRQMGLGGGFWQNVVHWRREWQTTSVFLPWESHEKYEKVKRYDTERWTPQIGRCPICYRRRVRNSSRKNEKVEPKWNQHPIVDVTGDGSKVWCCEEQHCRGTWNVRSLIQGKLEVIKQEMVRVNIDILGISELKWTGMDKFNSENHYIY